MRKLMITMMLGLLAGCGSTEYEEQRTTSPELKPAEEINGPVVCDNNGICTQLKEIK